MQLQEREFNEKRNNQLNNSLMQLDKGNINVMKAIQSMDPKYAKHMFLRNELVKKVALYAAGGIEILDQPVCNHCERPALWDKGGTAYCFSCHTKTQKPITVERYLIEYTKFFSEEQLEMMLAAKGGENIEIIE